MVDDALKPKVGMLLHMRSQCRHVDLLTPLVLRVCGGFQDGPAQYHGFWAGSAPNSAMEAASVLIALSSRQNRVAFWDCFESKKWNVRKAALDRLRDAARATRSGFGKLEGVGG